MSRLKHLRNTAFLLLAACLLLFSCNLEKNSYLDSSATKVALREVGNQLLLSQGDSTSLVLPVKHITTNHFELTFENTLAFDPNDLYNATAKVIEKSDLPSNYILEVLQCSSQEVVYSFQVKTKATHTIIPRGGRLLPEDCYNILFLFESTPTTYYTNEYLFYGLVFLVISFLAFIFISRYTDRHNHHHHHDDAILKLGSLVFYPEQNKLLVEAQEINLSKKETELLYILASQPNQVVKREELTKRVWEDHGVVVGRSLDTYISKLRKKLQHDPMVSITNIHGVGYKLVVD